MAINVRTKVQNLVLNDLESRRINRQIERLEGRLTALTDPIVTVLLKQRSNPPGAIARVRVRLGHLGGHVVAWDAADTADQAVRSAVDQVMRQLDRRLATQRGEPTFGVPSRRRVRSEQPPEQGATAPPTE